MSDASQSPVSFMLHVARLPQKGAPVVVEADARQRADLAAEHDLLSVERFRADLVAARWRKDGVKVDGVVEADVVQRCIVTLEPIEAHVRADVSSIFVPEGSRLSKPPRDADGEIVLDPDGPDLPEPFAGDSIDVGALAEEFFALALDPYPRKAGAAPQAVPGDAEQPEPPRGPLFDKLQALKRGS